MTTIIILSVVCSLLVILLAVITQASVRVSRKVQTYENFYEDTIGDLDGVIEMLDALINNRQMISDDPDVQNVRKAVVIIHDILVGYKNAKNIGKAEEEKEEKR